MNHYNASKTTFITNHNNYHYEVMPFGLKNTEANYQRLMDVVFFKHIGQNLEVYLDGIVVKTLIKGSTPMT